VFSSTETGCYGPTNWIEELNQAAAHEIDQAYWNREKRKWPVDVMGGARHSALRLTLTVDPKLRQTIIETERLLKDDEPSSHPNHQPVIECYDDGFPKLLDCLDRRPKPLLAQAA